MIRIRIRIRIRIWVRVRVRVGMPDKSRCPASHKDTRAIDLAYIES